MKKVLLYSAIAGTLLLASTSPFCLKAQASCAMNVPCKKQINEQVKPNVQKSVPPKMHEDKKVEFEERLKLTNSQKASLEKIKAEEKASMEPIREELKKEQEKIDVLLSKEASIRAESLKKFESMLNAKQKNELEKIKQEVKEEMQKTAPLCGCEKSHSPSQKCEPACPPDCGCKHHEKK